VGCMDKARLQARIEDLVAAAPGESRTYVLGPSGVRDLASLRDPILSAMFQHLRPDEPLLVASRDKVRIAGAVLASLAGGNEVILPHAGSPAVLEELRDRHRVRFVLTGGSGRLPAGLSNLPVEVPASGGDLSGPVRDPDQRIVRIFTGGSTGRPRLWDTTAHPLLGEALYLAGRFETGRRDVVLAAVTPQHIYGLLFSVLLPLVSGASVVEETPTFQGEMERALKEYQATVFAAAPPHFRALRGREIPAQGLRLAVSSGGLLAQEDSLGFSSCSGVPVTEVYGSTETGGVATRNRADGEDLWTAFPCVRWTVRDERLCVRSPFLSPGLLRDVDGYFITGDRARRGEGGRFELLGRADGIVKVAGKRVSLEVVEARIKALPFVRDAYVLAISSPATMRDAEIVCLAVPEPGGGPEDLLEFLRTVLGPCDLPRRIRWVPEIPLTAAGKRDRERAEKLFL